MLTHAFEVWQVQSVCLHTDARNQRSREAMERIGARFEGILRAHRLGADLTPREREIVGSLSHPNIARLLDAGFADAARWRAPHAAQVGDGEHEGYTAWFTVPAASPMLPLLT